MTLNFLLLIIFIFGSTGCGLEPKENEVKPNSQQDRIKSQTPKNTDLSKKTAESKGKLNVPSSSPRQGRETQEESPPVVVAQGGVGPGEQGAALLSKAKKTPDTEGGDNREPPGESQVVIDEKENQPTSGNESPVELAALKENPPADVIQKEGTTVDVCSFPESLRAVLVVKLNKHCSFVAHEDLTLIKDLKITGITQEESLLLTNDFSSYFTSLEELDISNNPQMLSLPSFVTNISGLKKLNISKTGIQNFSEDICQLTELEELVASHNSYEEGRTPLNTFCLKNLKVLNMSHSSLRHIDEYIYHLVKLEELYMGNNDLPRVPFVLHLMTNHLLVVDFSDNSYIPEPNWFTSMIGYESVEDLHNCKDTQPFSEERLECREEMSENLHCEWWYEYPFEEKLPFRRYKTMTDEEYAAFTAQAEPGKDRCYLYWLNTHYMELSEAGRRAYLEHTINGRTLRELRLLYSAMDEYWMDYYGLKAAFSYCMGIRMLYSDTTFAPSSHEVIVEDYYSGEWNTLPSECEHDRHLYPKHRNESR